MQWSSVRGESNCSVKQNCHTHILTSTKTMPASGFFLALSYQVQVIWRVLQMSKDVGKSSSPVLGPLHLWPSSAFGYAVCKLTGLVGFPLSILPHLHESSVALWRYSLSFVSTVWVSYICSSGLSPHSVASRALFAWRRVAKTMIEAA